MNMQENENEVEEVVIEEENRFDATCYEKIVQEIKKYHENIKECKEEFNQYEQIIQGNIEENYALKKENINLNHELMYELEWREKVLKSFSETDSVLQYFVEKKNTLQDLVDMYESDIARSELLNQQIAKHLEKLIDINKKKSNIYDVEYKKLDQNLQEGKKKIVELKDNIANTNTETIKDRNNFETRIIKLQEKKDLSKRELELIHKQIMDVNCQSIEIFNKTKETKLAFANFLQEKTRKTTEFEKKIRDLKEVARNQKTELKNTVTELESLQGASRNQKELQNNIQTQNEEMKNKISENKKIICALNEELENMKELSRKETEDSKEIEENAKLQIEKMHTEILTVEEENQHLQEKQISLNTERNSISANIKEQKLNYISMENEENNFKNAQKNENNKLREMVNVLQLSLEMENKKILELNTEEELLQNDMSHDAMLASYQNQYEKLCKEANANEAEINFNIDNSKENKSVLQSKLQENCKKLRDLKDSYAGILKKEEENNKRDLQKIINHSNFFEMEAERMRKLAEQKHGKNISKLESTTNTLQFQILKMQAQRNNVRKDLNLRVKELNDMYTKINKPDIEQRKDLSKKVTFKKPVFQELELPELKVPPSKYSSTSFSDSSFSSVENDSRLKKRREYLKKQRNKAKKANSFSSTTNQKPSVSSSQKELDDLFDSLKD